MNVKSVEKQEKSMVELVIEVSREEFEAAIDKVYKKQRGRISVPGFRKGHAPRKIIEGMYGSGVFYEDAINEVYPEVYAKAIEQEKLDEVAYPHVEIVEVGKEGFTFKARVAVRPEVKLGEYKGLSAPKETVTVTEADIDGEMKPLVERASRLVTVDRAAQNGDTVVLDFEGFKDGVPFDGGKAEGYSLELGSNSFIPGFEEQVVGMKSEEEKDLNVTFPAEYQAEDLAGKDVVFKVKVHEVKAKETPVLDDEFAKDVSEFDTLEALRKDLGDKLKERRETQAENAFKDAIMEQAVANMEAEIPDDMVDFQAEKLMEDYERRVTSQGIPFETYLSMMGMTRPQLKEQAMEGALRQVRMDLTLRAVAAAEGIEVTEEEKEAEIKRLAEQYSMSVEQVKAVVVEKELVSDLSKQKAADVIFNSAKAGKAPAKKAAKKTAKKAETAEKAEKAPAEEKKPAKKPAAKKTTKKAETAEKAEKAPAEEKKPAKKPAAKKTKKTEE